MFIAFVVWAVSMLVFLGSIVWRNRKYPYCDVPHDTWKKSFPHRLALVSGVIACAAATWFVGSHIYSL